MRFPNEAFIARMYPAELLKLFICDGESRGIAESRVGIVFPFNDKDLETLRHVWVKVLGQYTRL
ncbi:MAG: hypothetical protein M1840_001787 [Geoglossum simile]|nr:MAG: hypothetical protein M1840_001787 [Geoglossum simile]